ncbi:V4R domain protein [Methanobrevibacter woesei]|uniref:V4R domain protein n=1 Tax=Methanobrevibacter woesei TaxID=190976 RepID=A0A2U1S6A6_9EURY|nr:V4R domain-containing protein [Methanobrevibacter woesei]MCC9260755.1 ArsR family transcriptional regulator [Methanobrevibacter woesei]PWB85166.1 V4R domain protein [Methanobrevibacter woesei]
MGGILIKKQKPIQIFSNKEDQIGVNVVKSPVKLTILEMLRDGDMEFDEIVSNTGKSKSTISVHLKSLREDGIISYRMDPKDNRKKIFYLKSKYLGSVNVCDNKEVDEVKSDFLIDNIVNTDEEFSLLLFHTLRSMLIQEGININPILHDTGVRIGEALFNKIYNPDLDIFIENLADFWKNKGLGKLSVDLGQIIKITTVDCFECALLPKVGQPVCFLDAGIFEALFGAYFKLPVNVIEVKCYTMGDEQCTFEIEPVGVKKS